MNALQQALKSTLDEAEKLNASGLFNEEQSTQYNALIAKAKAIKSQLQATAEMSEIKSWASQSDGQSAVKAGWAGDALPDEGNIEGVSTDSAGEMYAQNEIGAAKMAVLKSGAYKDALNMYIRARGLNRPMTAFKGGDKAMKVLHEGEDSTGGVWVFPDMRAELVKKMATMATVRQYANVFTTGSDIVKFPRVNYTTDQRYTAGSRFSWVNEAPAANPTESTNPVSGQIEIPVHTALLDIYVTRQQLEDNSFDILGYLTQIGGEAYALGEEDVFWNGDGAGKPQGVFMHPNAAIADGTGDGMLLNSGNGTLITWGASSSGGGIPTKGIVAVESALPPQYESGAAWYATKKTYAAIRSLTDSQNRPLWQNTDGAQMNWVGGLPPTLLGYPVRKSQFINEIAANTICLGFGDLNGYFIADRVGLSIEVLREVEIRREIVVIHMRKRLGGQLVRSWQFKAMQIAA